VTGGYFPSQRAIGERGIVANKNAITSSDEVLLFGLKFIERHQRILMHVIRRYMTVQALRLCTGRTAHRGIRGIALLFHDQRYEKGVRGQRHTPAARYPRERPGTHCTGGWVGPRAGLDRCGKSRPHRDSIPIPTSP
jgi:hypothetical protein